MEPSEETPEFDPALAHSADWKEPSSSSAERLPEEGSRAAPPPPAKLPALPPDPSSPPQPPARLQPQPDEDSSEEGPGLQPSAEPYDEPPAAPTLAFERMELPDHELRAAETLLDLEAVDLSGAAASEEPAAEHEAEDEDEESEEDDAIFLGPGDELPPGVTPGSASAPPLPAAAIPVPEPAAREEPEHRTERIRTADIEAHELAAQVAAELGFGGPEDASDDHPMLVVAPPATPSAVGQSERAELQEAYECLEIRTPLQEFETYARARLETLIRLGEKERAEVTAAALRLGLGALKGVMGALPKEASS